MYMVNFRDMIILHLLIGAGITLFIALRDKQKNLRRNFYNFGPGIFGTQAKAIQWYCWSLGFELITSIFYIHTGMLYFELGMSIIEAIPLTLGAYIVDRFFDVFTDGVEITRPKLNITIPKISNPFKGFSRTVIKDVVDNTELDRSEAKKHFDDLTRDN